MYKSRQCYIRTIVQLRNDINSCVIQNQFYRKPKQILKKKKVYLKWWLMEMYEDWPGLSRSGTSNSWQRSCDWAFRDLKLTLKLDFTVKLDYLKVFKKPKKHKGWCVCASVCTRNFPSVFLCDLVLNFKGMTSVFYFYEFWVFYHCLLRC
jgi:hypothetical protein